MEKKRLKKQQKTTRKKYHHTHDASLPPIEVAPNTRRKPLPYMPKILVNSDSHISQRILSKIQQRLRFANPHDLRYLSCIRIVEPSAMKLPSKETTTGCYWQKRKGQEAEIWLSTNLFRFPGLTWTLINRFFMKQDRIFETLFHELGHHKAHHIRLISSHKQEAYAEKYMQAYKDIWLTYHRPTRIGQQIFDGLFSLFANKYVMFISCYVMRKRNPGTQHMYQLYKQYVLRKITEDEFSQHMDAMFDGIETSRNKRKKKKKWTHPLQQQEYRDKFGLDG